MELDPNDTYKSGFRELTANLGRLPTMAELLPLNIAYARSWAPAEETVLAPARVSEPLSAPAAINPAPVAVSEPEPPSAPSRDSQPVIVGSRGPGGGIMAACVACGQEFERPRSKGRPPIRCGVCR